jgi:hypothetical protein
MQTLVFWLPELLLIVSYISCGDALFASCAPLAHYTMWTAVTRALTGPVASLCCCSSGRNVTLHLAAIISIRLARLRTERSEKALQMQRFRSGRSAEPKAAGSEEGEEDQEVSLELVEQQQQGGGGGGGKAALFSSAQSSGQRRAYRVEEGAPH